MKRYFYGLLARYVSLFARPGDVLIDVDPVSDDIAPHLPGYRSTEHHGRASACLEADFVLLNGNLHFERDVQSYLVALRERLTRQTRVVVIYYSALWRPFLLLATRLGWRKKTPEVNWLAPGDVENFLRLSDLEIVRHEPKVLLPVYVPLLSGMVNRYLAPLPLLRSFCLVNVVVARPVPAPLLPPPSVSVIVPARNEAGNIAEIVRRLPTMGPDDELIFIEGGSRDDTWQTIQEVHEAQSGPTRILIGQQDGKGKGDAVRKGFGLASKDILMILDADITVPPEDLPKFYRAIVDGKGEFINGSRLVYPMEKRAMRFLNMIGNKFFAAAFSFVLGQRFKDTLCGTKVITRENYLRLAANRGYFGEFDPFGDFDLIFGAARMGLKIVEVPIVYRERTYGETNISRWRHGALLIAMLAFAARRLKFI